MLLICHAALTPLQAVAASAGDSPVWTREQAWDWYKKQPWIVGFNFIPSTACNTTEFWAADTFDEKTIDRELGWAQALGFNSCRVFVQYLVWKNDPEGLKQRLARFLEIAAKHGISTAFVLFDDCAFGDPPQTEPYLGKQRDPIPGMIGPSWTPSPGLKAVTDQSLWPDLEKYIKDVVGAFGQDKRVLMWDIYNEPGNSRMGNKSLPLVEATFAWARAAKPSQPLTMSPWGAPREISERMIELSDVVSFHRYSNYDKMREAIEQYKQRGRPVICTEWMARLQGSKWETDLPLFKKEAVGCYSWGLVNGRMQCQFSWRSKRGAPEPKVWFHDLFHSDGRPYDPAEHEVIRKTTADKQIDWNAADYTKMQVSASMTSNSLQSSKSPAANPRMKWADDTRGKPFSKDPCVIKWGGRYLMYYSIGPAAPGQNLPRGWAVGIAESRDLISWKKVAEILPEQECEKNGLVNGRAIVLDGKVHFFVSL
ncbi:MAG: cellulase family glycosylhydrolase [Candidatus Sumerlaeota bacterium]|nr:cellulase family glycosylhydrolase [Candidatus Sumerlaeota bacterium]